MTAPERSVLSPAAGTPVEHDPEHGHSRQSGLKSGRADDKPAKVFFQSSVPGGHENHFDELMAIMEASKGRPDADVTAGLRARYDIEQITGLR